MGIVMNRDSYGSEHDAMAEKYGEEIMCAGWNPAIALVSQQQLLAPTTRQTTVPADLATVDIESFLREMYIYQR